MSARLDRALLLAGAARVPRACWRAVGALERAGRARSREGRLTELPARPQNSLIMNVSDFLALLDIEPSGPDSWLAHSPDNGWRGVFGGQVLAKSLIAAERTVEGRISVFEGTPISSSAAILDCRSSWSVERVRDGRSFSVRRVVVPNSAAKRCSSCRSRSRRGSRAISSMSLPMPAVDHAGEATPDPVALAAGFAAGAERPACAASSNLSARSNCAHSTCAAINLCQPRRRPGDPVQQPLDPRLAGRCLRIPRIHRAAFGPSLRHDVDRHGAGRAGRSHRARTISDRKSRSCGVAASPVPRRRSAALRAGFPKRPGGAAG